MGGYPAWGYVLMSWHEHEEGEEFPFLPLCYHQRLLFPKPALIRGEWIFLSSLDSVSCRCTHVLGEIGGVQLINISGNATVDCCE